jgi:heme/copper-type cytochrome/quinol oxidase subunit 2
MINSYIITTKSKNLKLDGLSLFANTKGELVKLQVKQWILLLAFLPLFTILYASFFEQIFAQEETISPAEEYTQRNVEVWGLFFRMMVAAFIVGAIVQGIVLYVCLRYREGHKKNRFLTRQEEESGR